MALHPKQRSGKQVGVVPEEKENTQVQFDKDKGQKICQNFALLIQLSSLKQLKLTANNMLTDKNPWGTDLMNR